MVSGASSSTNVIIRPLDLERDAEGLARMFNESDPAWPGSWTDGVPMTAEQIREWHESMRMLAIYVAEVDGEIAGYCSFEEGEHGQPKGEGYLDLLNVHPKFHGQSIGRRLIQETIKRAVQEGWQRQTLGTWSANFKAVPAYKKTGHFWTPDSSVWMQNFIPGALQMSVAKPFFDKHDWYGAYVREIKQEQDDERWEGLKVFTERWEADGESLTIRIDREARAPVAVETDRLAVAAIVESIEPLAGSQVKITWRLANKAAEPLPVYLYAAGDKGLAIEYRDAFVLEPGQAVERTATVKVDAEAPAKKDDGTAPAVRTTLRLGADDLELFSGMRPRPPVRFSVAPGEVAVRPGQPEAVRLELSSEMDVPAALIVHLTPPGGLTLDWTWREVALPAKGHLSLPLVITAAEEQVYELPVRVERPGAAGAKPLAETVPVYSLGPGALLARRDGGSLRLESEALRVTVAAKGAGVKVEHKAQKTTLLSLSPRLGPVFNPSEFAEKEFSLAVEQRDARTVVRLWAEAERIPGLILHEEVSFSPAGVGTLALCVENRGSEPREVVMGLRAGTVDRDAGMTVLPLQQGVVCAPGSTYPAAHDDAPRDPAAYAEPWCAVEWRGAVAGLSWGPALARIDLGWRAGLDGAPVSVAPGQRSEAIRYSFYAGSGGWQDARRALLGERAARPAPRVRRPLEARVEPAVLATVADSASARLIVDSVSRRVYEAAVGVAIGRGATVSPAGCEVARLTRGEGATSDLQIALPLGVCGRFAGEATLRSSLWEERTPFEVLRLGTERAVTVGREEREGQEVWRVDNGAGALLVAPGFGPSMIAWEVDGVNMLRTNFPVPAGFSWMYPHFGGIYPQLLPAGSWVREGYLFREQIDAEEVYAVPGQGLPWAGVRLLSTPQHKDLLGLRAEVEFLTLGESPVVKIIYRLRNLRPVEKRCRFGLAVVPALGSDPRSLVALGEGVVRHPTSLPGWVMDQRWAAVTNEASGRTMLMVGATANVAMLDYGQSGRLLGVEDEARLAGDEVRENTYYLVLADSPAQARDYLGLAAL